MLLLPDLSAAALLLTLAMDSSVLDSWSGSSWFTSFLPGMFRFQELMRVIHTVALLFLIKSINGLLYQFSFLVYIVMCFSLFLHPRKGVRQSPFFRRQGVITFLFLSASPDRHLCRQVDLLRVRSCHKRGQRPSQLDHVRVGLWSMALCSITLAAETSRRTLTWRENAWFRMSGENHRQNLLDIYLALSTMLLPHLSSAILP